MRLQTPTGRSLFHVIRHRSLPKVTHPLLNLRPLPFDFLCSVGVSYTRRQTQNGFYIMPSSSFRLLMPSSFPLIMCGRRTPRGSASSTGTGTSDTTTRASRYRLEVDDFVL